MESWIRVSRNVGKVSGEPTRIWSVAKPRGYHGSVVVVLHNKCGDVIGVTAPRRWGVDGKWVIGGTHDRRAYWEQDLGVEITSRATSMKIIHSRDSDSLVTTVLRYLKESCQIWDVTVTPLTGKPCPFRMPKIQIPWPKR
ncbi:hypothetical protein BG844_11715 [Couchioplanes caeruleus subsp. caeruleus]|uniref:Uncharacterized protein n=2 Tax=Couchioplanes caeruleus TaxID=56438 RepID=A0A1K0FMX8_9ACTN|nr:hypothetical protein BG844_11715 [Couchioplanes caeruleus subsp. caeruleus]